MLKDLKIVGRLFSFPESYFFTDWIFSVHFHLTLLYHTLPPSFVDFYSFFFKCRASRMFTYGFVDSLEACVATGQKLTIHSHVVHARETLYSEKEKNKNFEDCPRQYLMKLHRFFMYQLYTVDFAQVWPRQFFFHFNLHDISKSAKFTSKNKSSGLFGDTIQLVQIKV